MEGDKDAFPTPQENSIEGPESSRTEDSEVSVSNEKKETQEGREGTPSSEDTPVENSKTENQSPQNEVKEQQKKPTINQQPQQKKRPQFSVVKRAENQKRKKSGTMWVPITHDFGPAPYRLQRGERRGEVRDERRYRGEVSRDSLPSHNAARRDTGQEQQFQGRGRRFNPSVDFQRQNRRQQYQQSNTPVWAYPPVLGQHQFPPQTNTFDPLAPAFDSEQRVYPQRQQQQTHLNQQQSVGSDAQPQGYQQVQGYGNPRGRGRGNLLSAPRGRWTSKNYGFTPAPIQPYFSLPDPNQIVLQQLEYYFSLDNLNKDKYLRDCMDDQGFVPISILVEFPRMRALMVTPEFLSTVASQSSILFVQDKKIRSLTIDPRLLPKRNNEEKKVTKETQQTPEKSE